MVNHFLQGSSNINVKVHNLQVILMSLLLDGDMSRVELAQATNLSNTTITNLVSELLNEGLVQENKFRLDEENDIRPVGRPRTGLTLQDNARFVLSVHINVGSYRVALANLRCEIINHKEQVFSVDLSPLDVLNKIANCAEQVIQENQVERNLILGVGIGVSGLCNPETGVITLAPNLNWHGISVKEFFVSKLGFPVHTDNIVRCMALGEAFFGEGRNYESLVFVYSRIGVGAGIINNNRFLYGSAMGPGEIGHSKIVLMGGEMCRCGNSGCLETLVSEKAFINQAQALVRRHPNGFLENWLKNHPNQSLIEGIITAAEIRDESVCLLLEERAYYLGVGLTNLINLINPKAIFLGGVFAQLGECFIDRVKKTILENAFANLGMSVNIKATSFGWKAGLIGPAALALSQLFYLSE